MQQEGWPLHVGCAAGALPAARCAMAGGLLLHVCCAVEGLAAARCAMHRGAGCCDVCCAARGLATAHFFGGRSSCCTSVAWQEGWLLPCVWCGGLAESRCYCLWLHLFLGERASTHAPAWLPRVSCWPGGRSPDFGLAGIDGVVAAPSFQTSLTSCCCYFLLWIVFPVCARVHVWRSH